MAIGAADFLLIPCMPDRNTILEAVKTSRQAMSYAQMRNRDIPFRILKTRWNPRGLAERAALDDLAEAKLPVLGQHVSVLSDYLKMTFTGAVPVHGGRAGEEIESLVRELMALKALPAGPALRVVGAA
jgi:chromosome partitioning protein